MSEDSNQIEQLKSEIYQIRQEIEEIKLNLNQRSSRKMGLPNDTDENSLYEKKIGNYITNMFGKNISKSFTNFDWD